MANQTVTVLEADGITQTDIEVLGFGRQAAAASKSIALSTEDKAALDAAAAAFAAGTAGTSSADVMSVQGVSGMIALQVGGNVAHDAVDSGNPNKIGGKAIAGLSTATLVAAADRSDIHVGLDGALITRPHCGLEDLVSGVAAITDGSSTSVIASAGAGVKNYITDVIISNSSATAVTVDLRDGAAGTVKATFPVPANTSGVMKTLAVPLGFSAATAVCADPSAAASTVTVTLVGFKSKV